MDGIEQVWELPQPDGTTIPVLTDLEIPPKFTFREAWHHRWEPATHREIFAAAVLLQKTSWTLPGRTHSRRHPVPRWWEGTWSVEATLRAKTRGQIRRLIARAAKEAGHV